MKAGELFALLGGEKCGLDMRVRFDDDTEYEIDSLDEVTDGCFILTVGLEVKANDEDGSA